jgi:ABC-type transport system involved in multi-copper enzyme maturation permease subunit
MTALSRQIRSELLKLTTTRTLPAVLSAMTLLVGVAVALHAVGLPADQLSSRSDQRGVMIDVAINVGGLFAALLGALVITGEFRSGTIRPTLLVRPRRRQVILAKAASVLAVGAASGLAAVGVVIGVGAAALAARGIEIRLAAGDIVGLGIGGLLGGALLAVLGLAVGAVVRSQVPTLVAIFAWLLFVENLLMDVPSAHRFVPGALGQAIAGQDRAGVLHSSVLATALLTAYAAVAVAAAASTAQRRDVA